MVQPLQLPEACRLTDCPLQTAVAEAVTTGAAVGALPAAMLTVTAAGPSPQLFRKKAVYCPGAPTLMVLPLCPLDHTIVQPLQLPEACRLTDCPSQSSEPPAREISGLAAGSAQPCWLSVMLLLRLQPVMSTTAMRAVAVLLAVKAMLREVLPLPDCGEMLTQAGMLLMDQLLQLVKRLTIAVPCEAS